MARAKRLGEIYVEINARLDKFNKDLKKARTSSERSQKKMQRVFDKVNFKKARQSLVSFNALLLTVAAGWGFKQLAGHTLETAAAFEQMEVKLNQLTGGMGRQTLEALNEWAIQMPVNTMEAVDSFVMMQAMGLDPTIKKMQTLVDVGSVLGDDVLKRVALQLGQTAAMGKIMGQEIRVLGEAGINARKYLMEAFGMTVKQVQQSGMDIKRVLKAIFDGMDKDFGGAAAKMMKSWRGLRVTFEGYVMELERRVMKAGVFDALKEHLDDINKRLWKWIELNEDLIKIKVPEYIDKIESGLSKIWNIIKANEYILKYGLIGLALFGKTGIGIGILAGGVAQRIEAINKALEMGLSWGTILEALHPKAEMPLEQLVGFKKQVDMYEHEMQRLKALHEQGFKDIAIGMGPKSEAAVSWKTPFVERLLGTIEDNQELLDRIDYAVFEFFNEIDNYVPPPEDQGGALKAYSDRIKRYVEARSEDFDILGIGLWNAEPPEGAIDAYIEKIERYVEAREEELDALGVGLWIPDEKAEDGFNKWVELSERTAWAMQDNFSSLFYDAVKGELKTFEDYMSSIFDSILRAWSDLMAQMAVQWLFGDIASAGGGGGVLGGVFEGIGGLFGGGGYNPGPLPTASDGGQIDIHFHSHSLDPATSHEMFMKNSGSIADAIGEQIGRGNRGLLGNLREANA